MSKKRRYRNSVSYEKILKRAANGCKDAQAVVDAVRDGTPLGAAKYHSWRLSKGKIVRPLKGRGFLRTRITFWSAAELQTEIAGQGDSRPAAALEGIADVVT